MKTWNKDITTIDRGFIFHQVNCQGVMGKGLALSLKKKFPGLEKDYKEFIQDFLKLNSTNDNPRSMLLGTCHISEVGEDLYVVHIFGQEQTSSELRQTDYNAVAWAFEEFLNQIHEEIADLPLYFPHKMGCGLGGGDWNIYRAIIESYFGDRATICVY